MTKEREREQRVTIRRIKGDDNSRKRGSRSAGQGFDKEKSGRKGTGWVHG